ncbi:hypothetical protein BJ165DRAFT_1474635 [Panaeolus papilionaceus]|nr:hypothetical protein BJ165DRAFT_1474635 [Panaeolus papilionaceus]
MSNMLLLCPLPPPFTIFNALTPALYMPAEIMAQANTSSYILAGGCAIFIWDFIRNLRDDYRLVTENGFRVGLPTIVYIISRIGTLGLVLCSVVAQATTIFNNNCWRLNQYRSALYMVAIPATTLLFVLRLRAIFNKNTFIIATFAMVWMALSATTFAFVKSAEVYGSAISLVDYNSCLITLNVDWFIIAPHVVLFVYDTMIFVAISWRLVMSSHVCLRQRKAYSVRKLIFGHYLPSFSRALLRDGQRYYGVTVSLNLVAMIEMFSFLSLPSQLIQSELSFTLLNIALMNVMACRVFRNTKFGLIKDSVISTTFLHSVRERNRNSASLPLRFDQELRDATFEITPVVHRPRQIYPNNSFTHPLSNVQDSFEPQQEMGHHIDSNRG